MECGYYKNAHQTIEAKDPYTAGHVWRISQYAKTISTRLGWDKEKVEWIEVCAMLHDLGKLGIKDVILQKEGKLSKDEFREIKKHPVIGTQIIQSSSFLSQFIHGIETHHERFDGKGYPYGLSGEDIPLEGRIIAVADTFDALTSHRPFRKAMSSESAIEIIDEQSGRQFDPQIVEVFTKLWWRSHFKQIILHSAPGTPLVSCPVHGEIMEITPNSKPGDQVYCPACKVNFQLEQHEEKWMVIMR